MRGRKPSLSLGSVASGIMGVVGLRGQDAPRVVSSQDKTTSPTVLLTFRTAEETTRPTGRASCPLRPKCSPVCHLSALIAAMHAMSKMTASFPSPLSLMHWSVELDEGSRSHRQRTSRGSRCQQSQARQATDTQQLGSAGAVCQSQVTRLSPHIELINAAEAPRQRQSIPNYDAL